MKRPALPRGGVGGLIGYFAGHPTAANLVLAAMLLAGLWGGLTLRLQSLPDVVVETIEVTTRWSGAGPEEMDRRIVAPIEAAAMAVAGVTETSAIAREGYARIDVEFEPGWDMSRALEDVRGAVEGVGSLPETAERPEVARDGWRDLVTDVVIHGPAPPDQLARYAEELRDRLFAAGVTQLDLDGAPDPVIRVDLSEAALARHDLTVAEVARAVETGADAAPAGRIGEGGARVRAGEAARTAEAIGGLPIAGQGGSALRVRDVATVRVEGSEQGEAFFVDGNPAVRINVERGPQGDAVAIQREVERAAAELATELPPGVKVELTRTRAEEITDRLYILIENGVVGLALVVVFLFLFLSARTAFWVAMGIPASMAAALGLMLAAGLTLNMISLFALILCLGIVVDDAIVVGEHADTLARRGLRPEEAAAEGARRMLAPVFAASVTTVIAFLSLTTIGGRFGAMIYAIPLTVAAVLTASLIESFVVLPAHMRHALGAKRVDPWYDWPSRKMDRGFRWVRDRAFRPFIRGVLKARWAVLGGVFGLLLASVALLAERTVPWRFFDGPERGRISANFAMLPGATREDSLSMLAELERAADAVSARLAAEHGVAPVAFSLGAVGDVMGWGLAIAEGKPGDLLGGLTLELIDPDRRPYSQGEFTQAWEAEVVAHPRLESLSLRGSRLGPGGAAISAELAGGDLERLKTAAEYVRMRLEALPGVGGLEDTLAYDEDELTLSLTPLGERLGFTTAEIGATLRDRLAGVEAASFTLGRRAATVEVGLAEAERRADYLDRARIRTPDGLWVALSEVVRVERQPGFSAVRRKDGDIRVVVTGEVSSDAPEATEAVTQALEAEILPETAARFDVEWRLTGLAKQEREFLSDALLGFAICMAGVYLTLAWVLGSWARPVPILLVVPLGLIGALWGHYWMGAALSMFSVVGLIGMAGIIVNDAIVLSTTIDEHAVGRALVPAIVDAAADRLRAVFLTTATTVAGLAPLLFERSTQAEFLKPTVITLVFGLAFGMVLVLVVTPALVAAQRDLGLALGSARRLLLRRRVWRRRKSPT